MDLVDAALSTSVEYCVSLVPYHLLLDHLARLAHLDLSFSWLVITELKGFDAVIELDKQHVRHLPMDIPSDQLAILDLATHYLLGRLSIDQFVEAFQLDVLNCMSLTIVVIRVKLFPWIHLDAN